MKAPCRQLLLQQSFSILGLQRDSVWGAAVYSQDSGNIDATFYEIGSSLLWFTLCKCKKRLIGGCSWTHCTLIIIRQTFKSLKWWKLFELFLKARDNICLEHVFKVPVCIDIAAASGIKSVLQIEWIPANLSCMVLCQWSCCHFSFSYQKNKLQSEWLKFFFSHQQISSGKDYS